MFIIASLDTPASITTILKDLTYLKQYVDRTELVLVWGIIILHTYILYYIIMQLAGL
jgi:hypothetical protein